jgi:hypothetical protein
MHGGVAGGRHAHPVVVALFDARTGERITDADMQATWRRSGSAAAQATGTYADGQRAHIRELLRDANQYPLSVDWSCLRRCALATKLIQINARGASG